MLKKPARGLFITGTDTEVGKSYVGIMIVRALIAAGHRVGVYKPAASDCVTDGHDTISEDSLALWQAAGQPLTLNDVCPQRFRAQLAPHLSARAEGKQLDANLLRTGISVWTDHCDIVIVEGAGGLMSPVSDDEYVADVAYDLGYPLIVVVPNVLGAINQTLQTLVTASSFRDGLEVAGIVVNDSQYFHGDASVDSNREEIAKRAIPPVIGHVHYEAESFQEEIDWYQLAGGR